MPKFMECRHILSTGRKCHAAALRGKAYCHHHASLHFRRWATRQPRILKTRSIEDLRSLQNAVAEALTSLRSPLTDPKRAAVVLYGLNLANNLLKQVESQPDAIPTSVRKRSGTRQPSAHNSGKETQDTTSVVPRTGHLYPESGQGGSGRDFSRAEQPLNR